MDDETNIKSWGIDQFPMERSKTLLLEITDWKLLVQTKVVKFIIEKQFEIKLRTFFGCKRGNQHHKWNI